MLLATAFISYVGCFTRQYRHDLINLHWIPFLDKLEPRIPRNRDLDILSLLTDDAQIAQWNNDGNYFSSLSNKMRTRKSFSFSRDKGAISYKI